MKFDKVCRSLNRYNLNAVICYLQFNGFCNVTDNKAAIQLLYCFMISSNCCIVSHKELMFNLVFSLYMGKHTKVSNTISNITQYERVLPNVEYSYSEITSKYITLTYTKPTNYAEIIKMIDMLVTSDKFNAGITSYIAEKKFLIDPTINKFTVQNSDNEEKVVIPFKNYQSEIPQGCDYEIIGEDLLIRPYILINNNSHINEIQHM